MVFSQFKVASGVIPPNWAKAKKDWPVPVRRDVGIFTQAAGKSNRGSTILDTNQRWCGVMWREFLRRRVGYIYQAPPMHIPREIRGPVFPFEPRNHIGIVHETIRARKIVNIPRVLGDISKRQTTRSYTDIIHEFAHRVRELPEP
jgi:hypothetical protein